MENFQGFVFKKLGFIELFSDINQLNMMPNPIVFTMTHSYISNLLAVCLLTMGSLGSSANAQTCSDENACNYAPSPSYCIRVETVAIHSGVLGMNDLTGMTTYRVYAQLANSDDVLSALIGDADHPGYFSSTTDFFQHNIGGVTPSGINPAFLAPFPSLAYDSWVTIGIEHAPGPGEGSISILEEGSEPWVNPFEAGNDIDLTGVVGGGWYTFSNYSNAVAGDDLEILIGQFTTSGDLTGQIYMQVFVNGDSENEVRTLVNLADVCGLGSSEDCVFAEEGYDCDGNCILDENNNGVCDFEEAAGCTQELACNYDPNATEDDGSCDFISCFNFGCTDALACNFDSVADYDDGTCEYANFPYDCDGGCINDNDGDGICDAFEFFGCTDPEACNFESGATDSNDSCYYDCDGCTDSAACNFDSYAIIDNGSCEYASCTIVGCTDPSACNYDENSSYDDMSCEFTTCLGCTNPSACNYDDFATVDNGTCELPDFPLDCNGNCINDADTDGICDEYEITGCNDASACNYDSTATDNDGSCDYCSCIEESNESYIPTDEGYSLNVEVVTQHTNGELAGMTTYRMYIATPHTDDYLSAVFGDDESPLSISSSTSFYQHVFGSVLGSEMIPFIYPTFPNFNTIAG